MLLAADDKDVAKRTLASFLSDEFTPREVAIILNFALPTRLFADRMPVGSLPIDACLRIVAEGRRLREGEAVAA